VILLAAAALAASSAPAAAQTLRGRALDEVRETPVAGALVRLLDRDGKERAQAVADSLGRFVLAPPRAGEYYLEATRLGYHRSLSPLLALTGEGAAVPVELLLAPAPVGVEGVAVTVDPITRASEDLSALGVRPADLGNAWITEAEIDAIEIKRDVGTILEWSRVNGVRVVRPENRREAERTPGSRAADFGMCISLVRGRTWTGVNRCALPVIDGLPATNERLLDLDPNTVAAMAVLQPTDARIAYGTRADAGAVLIWTKRGRE